MPAASEVWVSILLGGLLGLCYVAASAFVTRFARHTQQFVIVVFGGMLVRMALALAALVMASLLLPVSMLAFTAAFLCVFLVGLGVELVWILRHG